MGVSIETIEKAAGGAEAFVERLHQELATKTYKPKAVRRVYIDKPGGGKRPLGIPTVADRVVQTACLLILEPIFEADFEECYLSFDPVTVPLADSYHHPCLHHRQLPS
jgi:retron-type reverse transcriptase